MASQDRSSRLENIVRLAQDGEYEVAFNQLDDLVADAHGPNEAYYLGLFFLNGIGTEKDLDAAIFWITEAAKQGNTDADQLLEIIYRVGEIKTFFSLFDGFG